jgi:hypothetical protein
MPPATSFIPLTPTAAEKAARRTWTAWLALLAIGTLAHLVACFQTPRDSGDLGRRVLTGVMFNAEGWAAAPRPVADWAPELATHVSWGEIPMNYPPVTCGFFQFVAWIHPSLFAAKLALTLLEALCAWLVARVTGDRRLGIAYWCLPLSIWWVSHEGVFEPLQNIFVLLALLAWRRRREMAPGALLLAVQGKLSALFLAPWIAWTSCRDRRAALAAAPWTVAALLPTALAMLAYPVLHQVVHTLGWGAKFNVYHWRALIDASYRWWLPMVFVVWVQAATAVALIWLGIQVARAPAHALPWLGAFLFLAAAKLLGVFQPWYFLAFIPLWLPAVPAPQRLGWLILTQFCEPLSVWQLLFGPSGSMSPHGGFGLFQRLG